MLWVVKGRVRIVGWNTIAVTMIKARRMRRSVWLSRIRFKREYKTKLNPVAIGTHPPKASATLRLHGLDRTRSSSKYPITLMQRPYDVARMAQK
jgi:hypothetical protein